MRTSWTAKSWRHRQRRTFYDDGIPLVLNVLLLSIYHQHALLRLNHVERDRGVMLLKDIGTPTHMAVVISRHF